MNIVLFNFHDFVLLFTAFLFFVLALANARLLHFSRRSYISLLLLCLSSAAIPLDILISFGAGFRGYAVEHFPGLFFVFDLGYWLQAPCLLIFLRSIFDQQKPLSWFDISLFLPCALFALHQTITYYSLPMDAKLAILNGHTTSSISIYYVVFLRETLRLVIFGYCLRMIWMHFAKNSKDNEAPRIDQLSQWPIPLTFGLFALGCLSVIDTLLIILPWPGLQFFVDTLGLTINYLTLLMMIMVISVAIAAPPLRLKKSHVSVAKDDVAFNHSHILLIEKAMTKDKLFLDNALSLESLAKQLHLPPRTVSAIINRHFQCNFFEFINTYRIEEAKRMMADDKFKNCNILDIMLETGFNSKATFNSFFKKYVGMTPREYRKSEAALPQH